VSSLTRLRQRSTEAPKLVACKTCEDTGHIVADTCRCTRNTPMLDHIARCVIPCVCDRGMRLADNIAVADS
jgi:hypothetical protein